MLAMVSVNNNEFEQARAYHLQAIEISKNAGDRYGLARAYNNLSELMRIQRQYVDAKPYTMLGINLTRELGNRYVLPIMLINLAYSQVGLGEIREAYTSLRKSKAGKFLGDILSPTAVIVKSGAVPKVMDALAELGLFAEVAKD